MTIRTLALFVEVCRHGSMRKAAEQLFVSQSAVSQAVAELEKSFQTPLFDRLPKGLVLTEAGAKLHAHGCLVLDSLRQLEEEMRRSAACPKLRLGVTATIEACLLYPLLEELERRLPAVHIACEIGGSLSLEQKLRRSTLDVAILQDLSDREELETAAILDDALGFLCLPHHPLAGQTVSLAQLSGQPLVLREKSSGTRSQVEQAFRYAGLSFHHAWTCSGIDGVRRAVQNGRGIGPVSLWLVQKGLFPQLSCIRLKSPGLRRRFWLARHKHKALLPALLAFWALCQETQTLQNLLSLDGQK